MGEVVDVELSVPGALAWDDVEVALAGRAPTPGPTPGLVLQGVVLDVDEQDVVTLRLARGAIVLMDTVGEPPLGVVGRAVILHLVHALVRRTHV